MSNDLSLTECAEWKALEDHQHALARTKISDLFKEDLGRASTFNTQHEGLTFDYSKNKLNETTLSLLINLANVQKLQEKRERLFGGTPINQTERRPALHMALRGTCAPNLDIGGNNIKSVVDESLNQIKAFTDKALAEKRYKYVVNIGIGGSDFGPYMVCKSLRHLADPEMRTFFLSNLDPAHAAHYLGRIDPKETLFIVASKSFTTQETLTNAHTVKKWLAEQCGITDISQNFCAVTTNIEAAKKFGIAEDMIFPMHEWAGGRFSLWSSVGLSIALTIGFDNFKALLDGAHSADRHFLSEPFQRNIPVLMGMIGVWYRNFWNYCSYGVLPYSQDMSQFPQYIQQLEMESNGKSVDKNGNPITTYKTAPVVLGGVGSNAQHTFFQLLHQGSDIIPCDFIAFKNPAHDLGDHHKKLIANVIGQTNALMEGRKNVDEPHRNFEGNRPSNTIWIEELTPYNLGMLLAFYEHKIFVEGVIWNINSFDQFGVELGKDLARQAFEQM